MERNVDADWWNRWALHGKWKNLPVVQELRHRRGDGCLFLGSGFTSFKYEMVEHESLEAVPTWKLQLGSIKKKMLWFFVDRALSRYCCPGTRALVDRTLWFDLRRIPVACWCSSLFGTTTS